jgi:hypothetical protein
MLLLLGNLRAYRYLLLEHVGLINSIISIASVTHLPMQDIDSSHYNKSLGLQLCNNLIKCVSTNLGTLLLTQPGGLIHQSFDEPYM